MRLTCVPSGWSLRLGWVPGLRGAGGFRACCLDPKSRLLAFRELEGAVETVLPTPVVHLLGARRWRGGRTSLPDRCCLGPAQTPGCGWERQAKGQARCSWSLCPPDGARARAEPPAHAAARGVLWLRHRLGDGWGDAQGGSQALALEAWSLGPHGPMRLDSEGRRGSAIPSGIPLDGVGWPEDGRGWQAGCVLRACPWLGGQPTSRASSSRLAPGTCRCGDSARRGAWLLEAGLLGVNVVRRRGGVLGGGPSLTPWSFSPEVSSPSSFPLHLPRFPLCGTRLQGVGEEERKTKPCFTRGKGRLREGVARSLPLSPRGAGLPSRPHEWGGCCPGVCGVRFLADNERVPAPPVVDVLLLRGGGGRPSCWQGPRARAEQASLVGSRGRAETCCSSACPPGGARAPAEPLCPSLPGHLSGFRSWWQLVWAKAKEVPRDSPLGPWCLGACGPGWLSLSSEMGQGSGIPSGVRCLVVRWVSRGLERPRGRLGPECPWLAWRPNPGRRRALRLASGVWGGWGGGLWWGRPRVFVERGGSWWGRPSPWPCSSSRESAASSSCPRPPSRFLLRGTPAPRRLPPSRPRGQGLGGPSLQAGAQAEGR